MADATFEEVFDWIADREGQRVVIEIGRKDAHIENADFVVLQLHTTLGAIRTSEDREHGTGVVRIPIGVNERSGIEIDPDPECFQRGEIHRDALKVWQHDIYIGVAA